jgi:hypothetical protein
MVVAIPAGIVTASALADIDPASDILPVQNVFLPYQPKVCSQLSDALRNLTKTGAKAGYPVKVAVIGKPADLGGAGDMFGKPDQYAKFLASELLTYSPDFGRDYTNPALLIVMPGDFGVDHGGRNAKQVLAKIPISENADPNELVRAALKAIPQLAKANGKNVPTPKITSGCSKSGGTSPLIFIAPVALLLIAGLAATTRFRPGRNEG